MIPLPIAALLFGLVALWLFALTLLVLLVFFGGLTSRIRGKRQRPGWTRYTLDEQAGQWRVKRDDDAVTTHETPEQALLKMGREIRQDDS